MTVWGERGVAWRNPHNCRGSEQHWNIQLPSALLLGSGLWAGGLMHRKPCLRGWTGVGLVSFLCLWGP